MLEPEKVTINETDYTIFPFTGMIGWRLQIKLGKILSPALTDFLKCLPKEADKGVNFGDLEVSSLGGALNKLAEALFDFDPQGNFVLEILGKTQKDGVFINKNTFDIHFAGNYYDLVLLLYHVINVNNFFNVGSFGGLSKLPEPTKKSKLTEK